MIKRLTIAFALCALAACGGGGGGSTSPGGVTIAPTTPVPIAPTPTPTLAPTPTPSPAATPAALPLSLNLNNLPGSYYGQIITQFSHVSPRQMVMLPNGDLLIGTGGGTANFGQSGALYIVPNAEATTPGAATVFTTLSDMSCASSAGTNTNGVAFAPSASGGTIYVGMECSVWKIPYTTGDRSASGTPSMFLKVRTGAPPAVSDGDVHHTTSLVVANNALYVSVGSSCNACIETDPTRGVVMKSDLVTPALTPVASRLRNAIALAVNPATNSVWAGGAGQDCVAGTTCFSAMDDTYLNAGHPYEWIDPITAHGSSVDYQWPWCEENKVPVAIPDPTSGSAPAGTTCGTMIVPPVRAPAYSTIMGATFYNPAAGAAYAFPNSFRGGLFMTLHGSWHEATTGIPVAVPEVVFVPITGDSPTYPMNWTNGGSPFTTWARGTSGNPAAFMNGFQQGGTRSGRPAGLAVGTQGSLFISDDYAGMIYRIRPGNAPASAQRTTVPASLRR